MARPAPGAAEQEPRGLAAPRRGRPSSASGPIPGRARLRAIGITSQVNTHVFWRRGPRPPRGPRITWQDTRAAADGAALDARLSPEEKIAAHRGADPRWMRAMGWRGMAFVARDRSRRLDGDARGGARHPRTTSSPGSRGGAAPIPSPRSGLVGPDHPLCARAACPAERRRRRGLPPLLRSAGAGRRDRVGRLCGRAGGGAARWTPGPRCSASASRARERRWLSPRARPRSWASFLPRAAARAAS